MNGYNGWPRMDEPTEPVHGPSVSIRSSVTYPLTKLVNG
jgi:hypothetical protein